MLEEFTKYVSSYDMTNEKIKLKYDHSIRVMNLSEKYAKKLGFSKEDTRIAKLIGLLHDFGRFEQLKVYDSFDDKATIDHADYSIEQLFDKKEILKYTSNKEEQEIIKFAIKNHNKYSFQAVSNERIMKHAKLIRDLDKLDIIYLLGKLGQLNIETSDERVSKKVLEAIKLNKLVEKKYIKSSNDDIASIFSFVFDIYNDICLDELKQNFSLYYKRVDNEKIFKEIYDIINMYIDNRKKEI